MKSTEKVATMEHKAKASETTSAQTPAPKPSPYAAVPAAPAVPLTRN
jgi:hypothetical protein